MFVSPSRKARFARVLASFLLLPWLACGSPAAQPAPDAALATGGGGSGGAATGGALAGGTTGSGGTVATGGASGTATGGATRTGGSTGGGGVIGSGGAAGAGGTGGATASGGASGSGGASATGGTARTGGTLGQGGSSAAGGAGAGGARTGGMIGTGGAHQTGGAGGTGTGGATTAVPDAGPDLARRDASPNVGTDASYPVTTGKPTVYLAGDSTVQTYSASQAPQQGWGQRIAEFFTTDVAFVNKAIGGRSSKSFIDEGRLTEIVGLLKEGDYLFAQWGINDRYKSDTARYTDPATTFRTYLKQYIDAARGKKAIPVLVTPTPRLDYTDGVFHNGFVDYCNAIKAVGLETNTPVIDLQTMGLAYYTSIGYQKVVDTVCLAGPDVLHFRDTGAYQMARLVAQGVSDINLPISRFVRADKL